MRTRVWVTVVVVSLVFAGLAAAALSSWPAVRLGVSEQALARIVLPAFAGRVTAVEVVSPSGERLAVGLRERSLWPQQRTLAAGERLTVVVSVRRPGWAGWLVGRTQRRRFTVVTPTVHLLGRWLQMKTGSPVTGGVRHARQPGVAAGAPPRGSPAGQKLVPVGVVASGATAPGRSTGRRRAFVGAAAGSGQVSWFPARALRPAARRTGALGQTRAGPAADADVLRPVAAVFGAARPRVAPATPAAGARWTPTRWRSSRAGSASARRRVTVDLPARRPHRRQPGDDADAEAALERRRGLDAAPPTAPGPARLPARSPGSNRKRPRRPCRSEPNSRRHVSPPPGGSRGATPTARRTARAVAHRQRQH